MYERFTNSARKVMQLANQEAQRFNHVYIGTEHLWLGLVKSAECTGRTVLKNLDVDLNNIQREVEKIVQSGPEMVTIGKLPQTPRAKRVIEFAMEESRKMSCDYVGTEHLLLGLLREGEGVAAQVLKSLGLTLDEAREEVQEVLRPPVSPGTKQMNVPDELFESLAAITTFDGDESPVAALQRLVNSYREAKGIPDKVLSTRELMQQCWDALATDNSTIASHESFVGIHSYNQEFVDLAPNLLGLHKEIRDCPLVVHYLFLLLWYGNLEHPVIQHFRRAYGTVTNELFDAWNKIWNILHPDT